MENLKENIALEDMNALVSQFSKLGVQFTLSCIAKFIDKIEENYPKVPKEDFRRLAIETLKENNILHVDAKIPTSRPKVKDENRCFKILQTGKNKGMKCSLPKMEGSDYCKRHRNQILTSSDKKQSKMIGDYLKLLQPKTSDIKNPTPLKLRQYKDENIFLEVDTNIMFRKNEDKLIAFGLYMKNEGVAKLSETEIAICERNYWEYEQEE